MIREIFPKRTLPPGDPSRFVFWKWMPIMGPNATGPDEIYLLRLYVFRTPWLGVMIHWIYTPDWEPDALHSHPWKISKRSSFWAFILRGGYTEQVATVREDSLSDPAKFFLVDHRTLEHSAGRWHGFGLDEVHRISSVRPKTVTLCISGRKRTGWGFFVKDRIVSWREYVDQYGRDGAR